MIKEQVDLFYRVIWEYPVRKLQVAYLALANKNEWCLMLDGGLPSFKEDPFKASLEIGGRVLNDEDLIALHEMLKQIND